MRRPLSWPAGPGADVPAATDAAAGTARAGSGVAGSGGAGDSAGGHRKSHRKSHRTAVVAVPQEALWPPIQAIRQAHDRQLHRWMPHVTLLYPFVLPDELAAALEPLRAAAASVPCFEVELARFAYFRHRHDATLWLRPEPGNGFGRLRDALEAAFPGMDDTRCFPAGFTPHLSVGQARPQQARALAEVLERAWSAHVWRVEEVCLLHRGAPPDNVFRVWARAPLSGT